MSDLYVRKGHLQFDHASRSDVLVWLEWEKCEVCQGRGHLVVDGGLLSTGSGPTCPNCLSGLVPPAHQVEAGTEAVWTVLADSLATDFIDPEVVAYTRRQCEEAGRAALIAAMKAVSDD